MSKPSRRARALRSSLALLAGCALWVAPASPQETNGNRPGLRYCAPEVSESLCERAQLILGDWTERDGGVLRFSLVADGTVKADIVRSSRRMQIHGYEPGMMVLRQMIPGSNGVTWTAWASKGEAYHALHTKRGLAAGFGPVGWRNLGGVFIEKKKPGRLQMPATINSRLANYRQWYRRGGRQDLINACERSRQALFRGNSTARQEAADNYADALAATRNDPAAQAAAGALRSLAERERLINVPGYQEALASLARGGTPDPAALALVQQTLLGQAAHFAGLMGSTEMTASQLDTLGNMARNASVIADDMRDPTGGVLDTNSSMLTNLLNTFRGITRIQAGFQNSDSTEALEGIRSITGVLPQTAGARLSRTVDMPTEVAAAMNDVTARGYSIASDALQGVTDAINGDPSGLERARLASEEMQRTLSGETYGRAMLDAISGRLGDRLPVARAALDYLATTTGYNPTDELARLPCERSF